MVGFLSNMTAEQHIKTVVSGGDESLNFDKSCSNNAHTHTCSVLVCDVICL